MDYKLLILGALPPFFAILAEIGNPVSERAIQKQIGQANLQDDTNQISDPNRNAMAGADQRNAGEIAAGIAGIAHGAVKVSLLIPTWISVTSGLAAVLIEVMDVCSCIGGVAVWTVVSAFLGIKFFSEIDYYRTGLYLGNALRISLIVIGLNAAVILIVFLVLFWFPASDSPVPAKAVSVPPPPKEIISSALIWDWPLLILPVSNEPLGEIELPYLYIDSKPAPVPPGGFRPSTRRSRK